MEKSRSSAKFRQTTTGAQLQRKREEAAKERSNQRFFSRDFHHYQTQQIGQNVRRSRSTEWDRAGVDHPSNHKDDSKAVIKPMKLEVSNTSNNSKMPSDLPVTAFHTGTAGRPTMKTLDKKISVSSDQLDTLTSDQRMEKFAQLKAGLPIRARASYRCVAS